MSLEAGEVVLGSDVALKRGDVDEVLGQVSAEVDDLEGADDGVQAGELQAVRRQVDLLDGNGRSGGHGGEKLLQLFQTLAVRGLDAGILCRMMPRFWRRPRWMESSRVRSRTVPVFFAGDD